MARPYRPKRWHIALPDPAACWLLSKELHLSPIMAQVLYNRGFETPEAAQAFLTAGRDQILDPFLLKDMDRAVALIRARIAESKPIMVYGDYDVDGVTGTTVLVLALRALGATVDYYIPNRFDEGYGLNVPALEAIKGRGHDFVVSVDTGISAVAEAAAARAMGVTLIISDHHEPGPELPDVPALINPKRPDCHYPFKELSGVGVAFKLAVALATPGVWDLLDIVTLGTIADMVALTGENRAIVREGLAALNGTRRPGLAALMAVSGVQPPVTAAHIGYSLGPRINALGRMGSAMEAVELLTTNDTQRARELAAHLDEENKSRQEVEASILQEALAQAASQSPEEKSHVLVLCGEGWHHGVVGICASRVLDTYYRPTILLSIDGDEVRGSARSIAGFHMHRALSEVSDLFAKFGGHAMAAGMTLKRREDVAVLRSRLNAIAAKWLRPEDLVPELAVDAYVGLDQVSEGLVSELAALEPCGMGNPSPLFATRDMTVLDARYVGRESQHLKLLLQGADPAVRIDAVGWNMASIKPVTATRTAAAFFPELNSYQGRTRLQIVLKDLQSGAGTGPDTVGADPLPDPLTDASCCQWDPLTGLGEPRTARPGQVIDGRDERIFGLLTAFGESDREVAAGNEPDEQPQLPQPPRLSYLTGLVASGDGRILVFTRSPWTASQLFQALQSQLPERRSDIALWLPGQSEPDGSAMVIAPYGQTARGLYAHTVLYHPPYHDGQVVGDTIHLLWEAKDWTLAEAELLWPYPDRDVLALLYKLMKAGPLAAESIARTTGEITGPWTALRRHAAMAIFREIGLADESGRLTAKAGARFQLEASPRYRTGLEGRTLLAQLCTSDWPRCAEGL